MDVSTTAIIGHRLRIHALSTGRDIERHRSGFASHDHLAEEDDAAQDGSSSPRHDEDERATSTHTNAMPIAFGITRPVPVSHGPLPAALQERAIRKAIAAYQEFT